MHEQGGSVVVVIQSSHSVVAPRSFLNSKTAFPCIREKISRCKPTGRGREATQVTALSHREFLCSGQEMSKQSTEVLLYRVALPVSSSLVVSKCWVPPPTVGHHSILDRTFIVEPTQELRSFPVSDGVFNTHRVPCTISPYHLRLE